MPSIQFNANPIVILMRMWELSRLWGPLLAIGTGLLLLPSVVVGLAMVAHGAIKGVDKDAPGIPFMGELVAHPGFGTVVVLVLLVLILAWLGGGFLAERRGEWRGTSSLEITPTIVERVALEPADDRNEDARAVNFRCVQHSQIVTLSPKVNEKLAVHVEARRRIENITAEVQPFQIGLGIKTPDTESRPLSVAYRLGSGQWSPVDLTQKPDRAPSVWDIVGSEVRVHPGEFLDIEYVWQETRHQNDTYTDIFVVPTANPLVVVQAPEGFDYRVAFAGHKERPKSPFGAFWMQGELDSDQQMEVQWWRKASGSPAADTPDSPTGPVE